MQTDTSYGMTRRRRLARSPHMLTIAAVLIMAAIAVAGCSKSDDTAQKAAGNPANATLTAAQKQNIHIYTVAPSKFHKVIDTSGAVDFDNDQATSVLAPFSGPVSRLLVSPGDKVKSGDALATVESPDFATAISTYRKAISSAQTLRRLADLDKDLIEHQGVSRREQEQAESDALGAEADRDAALQALVGMNIDPQTIKDIQQGRPAAHTSGMIRSPIAGTVVERLITAGELLQAGTTPCFTIANLSRVWVMAQVFGADVGSVADGDTAVVDTGTGSKSLSGTVDNVAALVDPNTRSVAVRVAVDNPGGVLKKQMYVHVRLQAREESTGFLIPVSAILRDDENMPFVYVSQADGSFARQHVTLGYRSGDQYDISEGVKAGDQIVVDGGLFVQFMQDQ